MGHDYSLRGLGKLNRSPGIRVRLPIGYSSWLMGFQLGNDVFDINVGLKVGRDFIRFFFFESASFAYNAYYKSNLDFKLALKSRLLL